jgi:hypothetical protein
LNLSIPSLASNDSVLPVRKTMSERIRIARPLCIFFMTFVHVPPGIAENVYDRDAGFFDIVYFVLTRMIGLSSVSLLSIVSGYFVVASLLKAGASRLIASKLGTLVVPLVAWNVVMLALLAIYGVLSDNWRGWPAADPLALANAFLAVTEYPLDVPLWFLRDLFVCCLFAPLLYSCLRRFPAAVFLALAAFAVFGEDLYVLQRPQLLLFFGLGMWLRIAGTREEEIDRWALFLTLALTLMAAVFLTLRIERVPFSEMDDQLRQVLDALLRLTMAAAFWKLTGLIHRSAMAGPLMRLEPYAFFLFCSHGILFHFAAIPLRRAFGDYGSDLFPITFFAFPCLAVIAAVIGLAITRRSRLLLFLFNAGSERSLRRPQGAACTQAAS